MSSKGPTLRTPGASPSPPSAAEATAEGSRVTSSESPDRDAAIADGKEVKESLERSIRRRRAGHEVVEKNRRKLEREDRLQDSDLLESSDNSETEDFSPAKPHKRTFAYSGTLAGQVQLMSRFYQEKQKTGISPKAKSRGTKNPREYELSYHISGDRPSSPYVAASASIKPALHFSMPDPDKISEDADGNKGKVYLIDLGWLERHGYLIYDTNDPDVFATHLGGKGKTTENLAKKGQEIAIYAPDGPIPNEAIMGYYDVIRNVNPEEYRKIKALNDPNDFVIKFYYHLKKPNKHHRDSAYRNEEETLPTRYRLKFHPFRPGLVGRRVPKHRLPTSHLVAPRPPIRPPAPRPPAPQMVVDALLFLIERDLLNGNHIDLSEKIIDLARQNGWKPAPPPSHPASANSYDSRLPLEEAEHEKKRAPHRSLPRGTDAPPRSASTPPSPILSPTTHDSFGNLLYVPRGLKPATSMPVEAYNDALGGPLYHLKGTPPTYPIPPSAYAAGAAATSILGRAQSFLMDQDIPFPSSHDANEMMDLAFKHGWRPFPEPPLHSPPGSSVGEGILTAFHGHSKISSSSTAPSVGPPVPHPPSTSPPPNPPPGF